MKLSFTRIDDRTTARWGHRITLALWVLLACVVTATAQTAEFVYTGAMQTFTAPASGTYKIEAWGGRGGHVLTFYTSQGGLGGYAGGRIFLNAGQEVFVFVGGRGEDRLGNHPYALCTYVPGGWNGGGGTRSQGNSTPGGGASDIRIGGTGLQDRVLVAAGGGGAGWAYAHGGDGGGLTGSNGTSWNGTGTGAFGGTQLAGGAMGVAFTHCLKSPGTLGRGGDGGGHSAGGGGGGGGFYGGGGGGFSDGGGGGSSYIGGVGDGETSSGVHGDHGLVRITPELVLEDKDGDGYAVLDDCDDYDPTINPQGQDLCDGIDRNCDGVAMTAPVISLESSATSPLCVGDAAQLTAYLDGEPIAATWSTGESASSIGVAPEESTVYSATFTDANGCESESVEITVEVNPKPSGTISGDQTICAGTEGFLTIEIAGNDGPWMGEYTDGKNTYVFDASASPLVIPVTPDETSTYHLVSLSDGVCGSTSLAGEATVTVKRPPELATQASAFVGNDEAACGATVHFSATATGAEGEITFEIRGSERVPITSPYFFPVGTTQVTASASNECGTTEATFDITVDNSMPVITELDISLDPRPVGVTVPLVIGFNDNNVVSSSIDWGDGTITAGTLDGSSFNAEHIYTTPGVYTLDVAVTDACGLQATSQYQYVVVYDPYGGFVTGGGWFHSPEGAYVADNSATGKASFGFVSKYKKGSSVPHGNTDFQFHAAGLKFKSTQYEWLVTAGSKAMYKGSGELNDASGFGFLISAVDGNKQDNSPDKFRIKIWDASGSVVYDNQLGDADDAQATTAIGGGSIVIHDAKDKNNASAREHVPTVPVHSETTAARAYPNPFVNSFTLEYQSDTSDDLLIHLLDVSGRTVLEKSYPVNAEGSYVVEFPFASLSRQIYFVKINQGRRMEFLKVIRK